MPAAASEKPSGAFRRGWVTPLLVSLAMGAALLWVLRRGALPVIPSSSVLGQVPWWAGPGAAVLWTLVLAIRAARLYWLLRPVAPIGVLRVLAVGYVFFGAAVLFPLRSGELVRPALLARGRHTPLQVFGVVAAERVTDGLVLTILLCLSLLLVPHQEPLPTQLGELPLPVRLVPAAAWSALAAFAVAFVLLALFRLFRRTARRWLVRSLGRLSRKLARRLGRGLDRLADGLSFLRRRTDAAPFFLMTLVYWLGNAGTIWFLMRACGLPLGFGHAVAILGVLSLGILVPNAPGMFGTFQLSVYAGLALYLAPSVVMGQGSAMVFLLYLVHVPYTIVLSLLALLLEPLAGR